MGEYIRKTFTFEGKRYTVRGKTEKEAIMKMANKQRDLLKHSWRFDSARGYQSKTLGISTVPRVFV